MPNLRIRYETYPMAIEIPSMPLMTSEQFLEFCRSNPDLRVERSAMGEVIIIPPAYSDTGNRNFKIAQQLANWAEQDGTGEGFDSSSGFTLPNGAVRLPMQRGSNSLVGMRFHRSNKRLLRRSALTL